MLKYQTSGLGFSSGFNPSVPVPIDVRLVVDTINDRNYIEFVYPSMPVTVLGAAVVVSGVPTFPNMTHWRCLVSKDPAFVGPTTGTADWKEEKSTSGTSYKGSYNPTLNLPNLRPSESTGAALRAALIPGDFFIVSVAGTPTFDSLPALEIRDTLFWNGTKFDRFANTNPDVKVPLYDNTQGTDFSTEVLRLIRLNALREWNNTTNYGVNSFVRNTYIEGGKTFTDTFVALSDMTAAVAALPTAITPNAGWLLVTTTNGAKLGGTANRDDTKGKPATGAFIPATRSDNTYLSPEETDARIKQFGGNLTFIDGGEAKTYLTADILETARP